MLLDDGTRTYVWGPQGPAYGVDKSSGAISVYHTDGLGSVRAVTDAAGSVVQTYGTDAFGVPDAALSQGTSTQPFGYTGEQTLGTGLVDLRARAYDPSLGRFLQRDPFPGLLVSPLSLNRFTYVLNNPIRLVDPSGLSPFEAKGVRCGDWSSIGGALCPESHLQTIFGPSLHLPNPLKDLFASLAGATGRGGASEPRGRALTEADLGLRGSLQELRGTFTITGERATVRIDLIRGRIENPFEVIQHLAAVARAEGATTLRMEGVLANERLQGVLARRYALRTEGAVDFIEIALR